MAVVTFCNRGLERKGGTHPGFLSKSAFFVSAKKCKRVLRNLKRQRLVSASPVPGLLKFRGVAVARGVAGLGGKAKLAQ